LCSAALAPAPPRSALTPLPTESLRSLSSFINEKTQQDIKPRYFILGTGAFIVILLYLEIGAGFICNLVGFVYPSYASFRAIESPQKDDDVQWLTYWVVYGVFNLLEFFADFVQHWIPFYYFLKLGFLIFLMLPQTDGSKVVYESVIKPMFGTLLLPLLPLRQSCCAARVLTAPRLSSKNRRRRCRRRAERRC